MKRKVLTSLAVITLSFAMSTSNVLAASDVSIKVNGLIQAEMAEVENIGGYTFVEMNALFEMLNAELDWNKYKNCITATKGSSKLEIYTDTNIAVIDGEEISVEPLGVQIIGEKIMLPLRFVSEVLNADVDWNGQKREITINTEVERYLLLEDKSDLPSETEVLEYENALALAKKNSSKLKTIGDSEVYLDELRDDLGDSLKSVDEYGMYLSTFEGDNYNNEISDFEALQLSIYKNVSSSVELIRGIKSADTKKGQLGINEEIVNDSLDLTLRSYVTSIKNHELKIQLLEENIALGKENIKNLELKYELGMESEYNLNTAKTKQKTNELSLEQLKLSLENQKQSLKTLLGVEANRDIYVDYTAEFTFPKDFSLESFIMIQRESAPTIKILKEDVEVEQYNVRTGKVLGSESDVSTQNKLKEVQRDLKDAQDDLENKIRTTYNNLLTLQDNNKTLLLELEQAKNDYNTVVSSYKAGKKTIYDVNQAKLGILSAEKAVEENMLTYATTMFAFERPYLIQ